MSTPKNNNGTKHYDQYLNSHVHDNFIKKEYGFNLDTYKEKYGDILTSYIEGVSILEEHVSKFIDSLGSNKFNKIFRQDMHSPHAFNSFLHKNGCPHLFVRQPRVGFEVIYKNLTKKKDLFITNFSIKESETLRSLCHTRTKTSDHHDKNSEIKILAWLHNNNFIDATFCALEDEEVPVIDCSIIKPKKNSLDLIWEEYGEIYLKLGEERQRIIKDK